MPLNTLSLHRPITSYARVQGWIGHLIRNRRGQLRHPRVAAGRYLDLGCGPNTHVEFVNLDYLWRPGVDVCWDVSRGLPFADGTFLGVFSEHCLEHFPLPAAMVLLREVRRVLAPGGRLRLVVPDAELYLRTYARQVEGDDSRRFPYQDDECRSALWTPVLSVNRVFYQDRESLHGHRTMFDFQLLERVLLDCGFSDVQRQAFRRGADTRLLIDTPTREVESLYVEAGVAASAPT